jgi:hypothetical protein
LWRHSDEITFSESLALCDGSIAESVNTLTCTADNYLLYEAPYNLPWGVSVYVKVAAVNIIGIGEPSEEGNGANLLRAPDAPQNF